MLWLWNCCIYGPAGVRKGDAMIDMNAGVGTWPFRPTLAGSAASLEAMLRAVGVTHACAYALEAYFYADPQEANETLLPALFANPFFTPSAVLNPTLANARAALQHCIHRWQVPLVRLFPGYHSYALAHPSAVALAQQVGEAGILLGIHLRAEDERSQSPSARIPPVPFPDVVALARQFPHMPVIAFCPYAPEVATVVRQQGGIPDNLYIEMSFFEAEDPLHYAVSLVSDKRLLFGTQAPLSYPLANVLKVQHSETGTDSQKAIFHDNALHLLEMATKNQTHKSEDAR